LLEREYSGEEREYACECGCDGAAWKDKERGPRVLACLSVRRKFQNETRDVWVHIISPDSDTPFGRSMLLPWGVLFESACVEYASDSSVIGFRIEAVVLSCHGKIPRTGMIQAPLESERRNS
jgi:hypothetical protein